MCLNNKSLKALYKDDEDIIFESEKSVMLYYILLKNLYNLLQDLLFRALGEYQHDFIRTANKADRLVTELDNRQIL